MADVHGAADEIQGLIQNWLDANDLDQTLEDLHYIPRAIQEAFSNFAEHLREDTKLAAEVPDAIKEAAGDMAGIADKLREKMPYGMQRS